MPGGWRDLFESFAAAITLEQARLVRRLRVDQDETWRGVSAGFYDAYPDVLYDSDLVWNQLVGQALCEAAAKRIGEDPDRDPWN